MDAFSLVTAAFTVPVTGNNVTVAVVNSSWMVIGETLIFGQGVGSALTNPGPMTAKIVSIPSTTTVQVEALGQAGDVASGSTIDANAIVSPTGFGAVLSIVTNLASGSGTFTPGAATRTMRVECIGGGGSGGGSDGGANASAASGGGGGAYSSVFLTSIAASYAYSVGAGGVAPAAGANPGNAGADTTFGSPSICTAKGGAGGGAGSAAGTTNAFIAGAAGGSAGSGVGDVKASGGAGRSAQRVSGSVALAGGGGPSALAGPGVDLVVAGAGTAGLAYGGGGGGGLALSGSATTAGGAGASGLIRISEYS